MNSQAADHEPMRLALALAERGRGYVEPNPLVGAVLVRDGQVVGQGWHERFGSAHAELNALNQAGELAKGATLYVTLEPCCHFGKTPPCTEAVIKAGIRRVVAAMLDPFPQVAGQGVSRLREAGIDVEVGVGEAVNLAARQLNAPYLKCLRAGRPYVHAKWAMSLDGKIATRTGQSKWITGEKARQRVHELRGRMDAIIVGRQTLVTDDPMLTARPAGPRIATRVIVTGTPDSMPRTCQILDSVYEAPVLVLTTSEGVDTLKAWTERGAEVVSLPGSKNRLAIDDILAELGRRKMTNVLVEGGGDLLAGFMEARQIDEVHTYIAPILVGGSGAPSPIRGIGISNLDDRLQLTDVHSEKLGDDVLIHGYVR